VVQAPELLEDIASELAAVTIDDAVLARLRDGIMAKRWRGQMYNGLSTTIEDTLLPNIFISGAIADPRGEWDRLIGALH